MEWKVDKVCKVIKYLIKKVVPHTSLPINRDSGMGHSVEPCPDVKSG